MVDLPEPDAPTNATVEPKGIFRDTPFRAGGASAEYWNATSSSTMFFGFGGTGPEGRALTSAVDLSVSASSARTRRGYSEIETMSASTD